MTEEGVRVALADDDVLLREGLASLLERSGFDVVGQCGDAACLIDLVRRERPELVIVDIRMPPRHQTEGLDAARQIRAEFPGTAIMVLSAHVEVEHAMDLLASGERTGYLLKSRVIDVGDFTETLRRLIRGGSAVDPALVAELVAARRVDDPLDVLSPRERQVLALMAEGRSNSSISQQLWVTEGTVEKHVRSILMKLRLEESDEVHRRVLAVLTFLGARLARPGRAEYPPDPRRRQVRLGEESGRGTLRDQVRVVVLGSGRCHDHGDPVGDEVAGEVKAVLRAKPDVDDGDVGLQRVGQAHGLGAGRCGTHHRDAITAQEDPRGFKEGRAVVDQ
jgi:DNA-binding NarL/FixJ family response regulator